MSSNQTLGGRALFLVLRSRSMRMACWAHTSVDPSLPSQASRTPSATHLRMVRSLRPVTAATAFTDAITCVTGKPLCPG